MRSLRLVIFALAIVLMVVGVVSITNVLRPKAPEFSMSKTTVIKEIRQLSRLETASFTIEKVIDSGSSGNELKDILFGDRILLIAHGQVIAGFDLATLSENDISVKDRSVSLKLPAPKILLTTLDNGETRVYDRRKGLLSPGDKDLESRARIAATDAISKAACEGKILSNATENARKQLTALLRAFGFTNISIEIPQGQC